MMFSKSADLDDRYQHIFNSNPVVTLPRKTVVTLPRKSVVTLARNQVVTLKRNSVVTLDGISTLPHFCKYSCIHVYRSMYSLTESLNKSLKKPLPVPDSLSRLIP